MAPWCFQQINQVHVQPGWTKVAGTWGVGVGNQAAVSKSSCLVHWPEIHQDHAPPFPSTFPISCWLPWSPGLCLLSSNVSPSDHQCSPLFSGVTQLLTNFTVLHYGPPALSASLSAGMSGVTQVQPTCWPVSKARGKCLVTPGGGGYLCHRLAVFCMKVMSSL